MRELIVDNFAGGGGASLGIETALGRPIDIAINHDRAAIQMHQANHPRTKHLCEDIWTVDPVVATKGRPVGLAWFSPDCTHYSKARGGRPVKKKIRGLAWVVIKWARTVRPRIIMLENVEEFRDWGPVDKDSQPIKERKEETFEVWINKLKRFGYDIECRELGAADYGAPTSRKRLFIIARGDGEAIVWPEASHGHRGNAAGLPRYRTAAECIDWSIPCTSIFERKRPLVENTMKRIARGLKRYVIEAEEPFIVMCNHGGDHFRGQGLTEPMRTITAARDAHGLVVPHLSKYHGLKGNETRGQAVNEEIRTLDTQNRFALVAAFLAKHYGGATGAEIDRPYPTITARGTQNQIVATHLIKYYGTNTGSDMRESIPTITATGQHIGEVRAFLIKYYGANTGQSLNEPAHTITSKHRLGLVTVSGEQYQIVDIGMRMLQPRELARAQGFPDSYILTGTKTSQVAKIGNSVCPPLATALVRANVKIRTKKQVKVA